MKRIADRAWTWILCLLVCVGAVCFLIGRLSAGDAVRMQTEKSSASTAEAVRADDAATEAAPAPQPGRDTSPLTPAENLRLYLNKATKEELMQLPPGEILQKAYEYVCREDILLSLEYNDLSPKQAKALLKSPTPLADVFKKWDSWEGNHHMENIWNAVEAHANEVVRAVFLPRRMQGDTQCHSSHRKPSKKRGRWTC